MRLKKSELDIKNRRNIYNFVLKHPGYHYREIVRALKISKNNLSYHLNYLKKHGLIREYNEDGYTRYYIENIDNKKAELIAQILGDSITYESKKRILRLFKIFNPSKKEREVINLLRRPPLLKIVRFLYSYPGSTQKQICKILKKHRTMVYLYLNKLIDKEIVIKFPDGKCDKYKLKDEEFIFHILRFYFHFKEELDENGDPIGKSENEYWNEDLVEEIWDCINIPFCAGFKPWVFKEK